MFDSSAAKQNYFDVRTAAVLLGIAPVTLRRMISLRRIEHLRVGSGGRRVLFTKQHLDAYLQRATVPAD